MYLSQIRKKSVAPEFCIKKENIVSLCIYLPKFNLKLKTCAYLKFHNFLKWTITPQFFLNNVVRGIGIQSTIRYIFRRLSMLENILKLIFCWSLMIFIMLVWKLVMDFLLFFCLSNVLTLNHCCIFYSYLISFTFGKAKILWKNLNKHVDIHSSVIMHSACSSYLLTCQARSLIK